MATTPPPNPPQYVPVPGPPAPGPKKTNPIVWILGIIVAFVVLGMLGLFVVGVMVAHKVKKMADNPGVEVTKMIASMNPDVSVVSTDDERGTITIRDKKTGKTVTMNFNDARKGKFSFDSDGEHATINAFPDGKGGIEIASEDGSVKIGSGGKVPGWVPVYPGAEAHVNFSAQGKDGASGTFQFETADAPEKVAAFYSDRLKEQGLKITGNISGQVNEQSGSMLTAENDQKTRTVLLTIGRSEGKNTVNVVFTSKE